MEPSFIAFHSRDPPDLFLQPTFRLEAKLKVTMAIIGAHVLLYTPEADALRMTFRDVFGWKHVDAGDGWLIFALPPAELGVHPAEGPTYSSGVRHQFTLMCDDIETTTLELRGKGIEIKGEPCNEGFGITVTLILPGGVEVLLYEPRHPVAITPGNSLPDSIE